MNPYDSRFAQELQKRIVAQLTQVHSELGNGSQIIRDDAAATGMNCAKHIGKIAGLEAALALMKEVDKHMNGKGP